MDKEKKQMEQIKAEERKRLQQERDKKKAQQLKTDAIESKNSIAKQRDVWYQKYKDAAEKKQYKEATWAFKMFRLMQKLYVVAEKYVSIFDVAQAINQMMKMLLSTNESFKTLAKLSTQGQTRKIKRNLKKFKRSVARFERFADEIVEAIDSIFDEKKGRKKKDTRSEEEIFNDTIGADASLLSQYESEKGIDSSSEASSSGTYSPSAKPSAGPSNPGGAPFGIEGPND